VEPIPAWVKSIAGWWSEGKVTDSEFIQAMQFLISNKVINIPTNDTTLLNEISQLQQQNTLLQSQLNSANLQISNLQDQLNGLNKTISVSSPPTNNTTTITSDLSTEKVLAQAWAEDKITDSQYIAGMQSLIDQHKVLPYTESEYNNYTSDVQGGPPRAAYNAYVAPYNPNQPIPQWIKTNAGWWSSGQLSYQDYRVGIHYLFQQGVLRNPLN